MAVVVVVADGVVVVVTVVDGVAVPVPVGVSVTVPVVVDVADIVGAASTTTILAHDPVRRRAANGGVPSRLTFEEEEHAEVGLRLNVAHVADMHIASASRGTTWWPLRRGSM